MPTKTEICNMALSHIGVGREIVDLDSERSGEALACRRFYDLARDTTLRDFNWPFATKFVTLGLVEEEPNDEWDFSYRYPSDCLMFRRILSGVRTDTRQSRIPYKIGSDDDGLLIFTDQDEADGEYTSTQTDAGIYRIDFVAALSLRLAVYIAPRLTGGDPFKMGERALNLYRFELSRAQASAANEEQPDQNVESELIRGRE